MNSLRSFWRDRAKKTDVGPVPLTRAPGSPETIRTFTEEGFCAKKQWILPDAWVDLLKTYAPWLLMIYVVPLVICMWQLPNEDFILRMILIVFFGMLIGDMLTALSHFIFVDHAFSQAEFAVDKDGYMVTPVMYGYSSCHHIFPLNWHDIDNLGSMMTVTFNGLVPYFCFLWLLNTPSLRIMFTVAMWCIILSPVTHKYMHEIHHKQTIPRHIDVLWRMGLITDPEIHVLHHKDDAYHWSLFNGIGDPFFNAMVWMICQVGGIIPKEVFLNNVDQYREKYRTDVIKLRFVGDIEGKMICRYDAENHVFYRVKDEVPDLMVKDEVPDLVVTDPTVVDKVPGLMVVDKVPDHEDLSGNWTDEIEIGNETENNLNRDPDTETEIQSG